MLEHLDDALRKLLEQELPSGLGINFATPGQGFPANLTRTPQLLVNLFLYDIRENLELRDNEWSMERRLDSQQQLVVIKQRPPVRVDCSYLATAWSKADSPEEKAIEEHRTLGYVARALLKYPTIPKTLLHESLRHQELPLPALALTGGQLKSPSDFWQAMGGKPRPALHYTVTLALLPWEGVEAGPPVVEKDLELRQLEAAP